jgi:hypothetical protein
MRVPPQRPPRKPWSRYPRPLSETEAERLRRAARGVQDAIEAAHVRAMRQALLDRFGGDVALELD